MAQTFRTAVSGWLRAPALRRVRACAERPGASPQRCFAGVSDDLWYWAHATGRARHPWLAELLPGLPDAALQERFTGESGEGALRAGFEAFRIFRDAYERHAKPLAECRGVLDFGCGWGRILRFFLRDVPAERLVGADHSEAALEAARATNRWCRFELVEPHPPTHLAAGSFELVYLFSVFSHLPEAMHLELLAEFERLLAPGGILIATTRGRDFIEGSARLARDPELARKPDWLRVSAGVFGDAERALAQHDAGRFCYGSHGLEGRWSFWGEAAIPQSYVEREWSARFELCEWISDRRRCSQDVIVARKRG